MDLGIAFIRGLNFYSTRKIKKGEILRILKKAEAENLKILGSYKTDNIIFVKGNIHYATVGRLFEDLLERHFKNKVYVTTRSLRSVKGVLKKIEELKG